MQSKTRIESRGEVMSSVEILQYVAMLSFALAVLCAVLCVVIFFRQDIRGVIGDLTGKTVAREVSQIRKEHQKSEDARKKKLIPYGITTSNLSKSERIEKQFRYRESNHAVQLDADETTLLQNNEMETVLLDSEEQTTVLKKEIDTEGWSDMDSTTILSDNQKDNITKRICIKQTIMVVHTEDIIA